MARSKKQLYHNFISYVGVFICGISTLLILGTLLWGFALKKPSPYLGIFTYLVFPAIFLVGLIIFFYGMRRESLRRRRVGEEGILPYPKLDLNDPYQRKIFVWVCVLGSLITILFAFLGYNAFVFTESVTFCGKICHEVMEPEYKAYLNGPHARVPCVDCHVGKGVPWYVKSKLTGLYQVYSVLADAYPRPIPVPITSLRPAKETCEECHWPEKFFGAKLVQRPRFRYDEQNTAEQISIILKTGGGDPRAGQLAGTHWHMTIENEIEFRAKDIALQEIVWVRARHMDGSVTEYFDRRSSLTKEEILSLPIRKMDCMDCHNRPAHVFLSPEQEVDMALAAGRISPSLPWVKKVVVDALAADYSDTVVARQKIAEHISLFYKKNYPDIAASRQDLIEKTIQFAIAAFERNVFPRMKVNFRTYPSNVGHRDWPGCFRCHDGEHVSSDGKVISRECSTCHTLPIRGPLTPLGALLETSEKEWHPFPLLGKHESVLCNKCHERPRLSSDCAECHRLDKSAPMMQDGCDQCHKTAGRVHPLVECKECHEEPQGLHEKHSSVTCTICHQEHKFKMEGREKCYSCHTHLKSHYEPQPCAKCHEFAEQK